MDKPKSVLKVEDLPVSTRTGYPPPHDAAVKGRGTINMGDAFGLTQFGARITVLPPGVWSSQRHWHEKEDELVYALEGDMVLVDDHGRHSFPPGSVAGFKAGTGNGHHFINVGKSDAKILVVGSRIDGEVAWYSDLDMKVEVKNRQARYLRKDGAAI